MHLKKENVEVSPHRVTWECGTGNLPARVARISFLSISNYLSLHKLPVDQGALAADTSLDG